MQIVISDVGSWPGDVPAKCVYRIYPCLADGGPGLPSHCDGASPDGSMVHVSIWDSEEHAGQMRRLKEMIVDARNDAEKAGGQLHPDRQLPGRLGVGFPS